jgi:hypothetical protein
VAFASGMAYGFGLEVEAPLVGAAAGGVQVALTNLMDAKSTLGKAWVPQIWPTNGELLNTASGAASIVAVALSAGGHGRFLQAHPKARVAVLAYGLTSLVAGWLIPGLIRWVQGGVFGARGRRGAARGGRYAYMPTDQLRADSAFSDSAYGTGVTQQANQVVFRRLFTAQ